MCRSCTRRWRRLGGTTEDVKDQQNLLSICAAGQELDVRALHEAVAALGGYDAVTTARQWPRVRDALGIDPYVNANGVLRCALIRSVMTTADSRDRPRKSHIHGGSDHTNGAPVRTRTNHAAQTDLCRRWQFQRCSSASNLPSPCTNVNSMLQCGAACASKKPMHFVKPLVTNRILLNHIIVHQTGARDQLTNMACSWSISMLCTC